MTTCKNQQPLNFANSDPATFKVCTFLVNVVSNMYDQWKDAGFPDFGQFNWQPVNACPVTADFKVTDYHFGDPIWSTFTYSDKKGTHTAKEPFASLVKSNVDGSLYLVFRGSKSDADFSVDNETQLVAYTTPAYVPPSDIRVEQGWYAVYTGLYESLRVTFKSIRSQNLIITGHSLGSALATLAVPDAVVANLLHVRHYNSASPRVGNASFAAYYESLKDNSPGNLIETYRLVNTVDEVPDFPKESLGYVHVGTQVSFTAEYSIDLDDQKRHNPCCSYAYAIYNPANPCNQDYDSCARK